jgi:hypothetical protein
MDAEANLSYESRVRLRYAVVATAAGLLVIISSVLQLAGPHPVVNELTLALINANKRSAQDIVGAVLNGASLVGFALAISFLAASTRARRPATSPAARILTLIGGVLAAISGIAYAVLIAIKAHDFVTTGNQTYQEAHHLAGAPGILAVQVAGEAAALLLAFGIFFVALPAMRVGLLTRFMGYMGLFVGALMIIPLVQVPVVQAFWFIALGALFAGRWPNGDPPAWKTGRAEAWPSSAEMREQRQAAASAAGNSKSKTTRAPKPEPGAEQELARVSPAPSTRANTPKRKRKKRK